MLHREIIGVYFWNHTEYVYISTVCGNIQNFVTSQQMVNAVGLKRLINIRSTEANKQINIVLANL
jgi:hypothetical protein